MALAVRGGRALNYVGQLRAYSYADLLLLLAALEAGPKELFVSSSLWMGFLVHLEWRHRDVGRLRWPWQVWAGLWLLGFALRPAVEVLIFFLVACAYTLKKRYRVLGLASPVVNGAVKAALVGAGTAAAAPQVILVFLVMAARNLCGDVRDAKKDYDEGVVSVPVVFGYRRSTPYVYPVALALTSALWAWIGDLPVWLLVSAWAVEAATYHLTPR